MKHLPLIVDLRRNSLDDGPGIRTTVFFKGCVLNCVWCQNPETIGHEQELQRRGSVCIGCRSCETGCDTVAVTFEAGQRAYDRARCRLCGKCVETCPASALRIVGRTYTLEALVGLLLHDEPFFRHSGGGVTLSGGEPTLHASYVAALAQALGQRGVHVLLQTCGLYGRVKFERDILPWVDSVYPILIAAVR